MIQRLLVLCTGNICRSPLAEVWFRREFQGRVVVESAGLAATPGHPADPLALETALANGLDLSQHRARRVTPEMLRATDLVLTMEQRQRDQLLKIAPWATGKVWRIGSMDAQDVGDPYRSGRESFQLAFHAITRLGRSWLGLAKET